MKIRHIEDGDWNSIVAMEAQAYPTTLSEDRAALSSKHRASPSTCFVLETEEQIAGYVLSLPYPRFQYPALAQTHDVVHASDNLHLHDLVIGATFRGRGFAKRLLHQLASTAASKRFQWISLIAVAGSDAFWSTQGFNICPEIDPQSHYGPNAVYMSYAIAKSTLPLPEREGNIFMQPVSAV